MMKVCKSSIVSHGAAKYGRGGSQSRLNSENITSWAPCPISDPSISFKVILQCEDGCSRGDDVPRIFWSSFLGRGRLFGGEM